MLLNASTLDVLPPLILDKKNKFSREKKKLERHLVYYEEFENFIDSVDRGNSSLKQRKEIAKIKIEIGEARDRLIKSAEKDTKGYLKKLNKRLKLIREQLIIIRNNLIDDNKKEYKKQEELFLFNKSVQDFLASFKKSSLRFFVVTREKHEAFKKNPGAVVLQDEIEKRMALVRSEFPALFVVLSREAIPNIDNLLEKLLEYSNDDKIDERLELKRQILKLTLNQMKKSLLKFNDSGQLVAKSRINENAVITRDLTMIERVTIGVDLKKLDGINLQFEVSKMPPTHVFNQFRDQDRINCRLTAKNELRAIRDIKSDSVLCRDMTDDELLNRAKITQPTFIEINALKARHELALTQLAIEQAQESEAYIDLTLRLTLLDEF